MFFQNTLGKCNVPLVSAPPTATHDPIRSSLPPTLQDVPQLPCLAGGQPPSSSPMAVLSATIDPTVPIEASFTLPSVLSAPLGAMGAPLRIPIIVPIGAPLHLGDLPYLAPMVVPSPTNASGAPSEEPTLAPIVVALSTPLGVPTPIAPIVGTTPTEAPRAPSLGPILVPTTPPWLPNEMSGTPLVGPISLPSGPPSCAPSRETITVPTSAPCSPAEAQRRAPSSTPFRYHARAWLSKPIRVTDELNVLMHHATQL
jgi:hypothetical protein